MILILKENVCMYAFEQLKSNQLLNIFYLFIFLYLFGGLTMR